MRIRQAPLALACDTGASSRIAITALIRVITSRAEPAAGAYSIAFPSCFVGLLGAAFLAGDFLATAFLATAFFTGAAFFFAAAALFATISAAQACDRFKGRGVPTRAREVSRARALSRVMTRHHHHSVPRVREDGSGVGPSVGRAVGMAPHDARNSPGFDPARLSGARLDRLKACAAKAAATFPPRPSSRREHTRVELLPRARVVRRERDARTLDAAHGAPKRRRAAKSISSTMRRLMPSRHTLIALDALIFARAVAWEPPRYVSSRWPSCGSWGARIDKITAALREAAKRNRGGNAVVIGANTGPGPGGVDPMFDWLSGNQAASLLDKVFFVEPVPLIFRILQHNLLKGAAHGAAQLWNRE